MNWLESWEGSYNGDWLGSNGVEPPGSMMATLRGTSFVGGKLVAELTSTEDVIGIGFSRKQRHIHLDDSQAIEIILRCAVKVLNNNLHLSKSVL